MSTKPAVILDMNGLPLTYDQGELRFLFDVLAGIVASPNSSPAMEKDGKNFLVRQETCGLFDGYGGAFQATVVYQLLDSTRDDRQEGASDPKAGLDMVVKVIALDIRRE